MIARVAAVVLIATLLLPSLLAQPRTVTFTKELKYMSTNLLEVTVTAPAEVVEGEEFEVAIHVRVLAPLREAHLYVSLEMMYPYVEGASMWPGEWDSLGGITIAEETNLTAGWETTVRRRFRVSMGWGDVVAEVMFFGYYPRWGKWEYADVEWYFPVLRVVAEEVRAVEQLKARCTQLEYNYSELAWRYYRLNESYQLLQESYRLLQGSCAPPSELSTYRALTPALAATLIAGVPLAYLLGRRHGRAKARPPQATGA